MNKRFFTLLLCTLAAISAYSQPTIQLENYASGFTYPLDIENAGDGRLFIVERQGKIKIINEAGVTLAAPFLDIGSEIEDGYEEQGLLGLAFDLNYAVNGYFYVNYTDVDGNTVVSRFSVNPLDSNDADEASEEILFTVEQPYVNHNGGCIKFGPDGYLYIGMGDGGSAGDPENRAQNPMEALGKMHRIDVSSPGAYTIPADNPFAGAADTLETIWDLGIRNPWRFSFDRLTGDLWIADVGQNLYEEVDFEPAGEGGKNYGWRCYEGNHEFNTAGCEDSGSYNFPVLEYYHSYATGGFVITGGFVYRGSEYPGMYGYYICADFESGNWWTIYPDGAGGFTTNFMADIKTNISGFGEDKNGELYCSGLYTGIIYKVTDACGDFAVTDSVTNYTCGVEDGAVNLIVSGGTAPYSYEWSSGQTTQDISGLIPGSYGVIVTDDAGCERVVNVIIDSVAPFEASVSVADNILYGESGGAGVSWQWFFNGDILIGATNNSYTPAATGNYFVLITDANGCTVSSDTINFVYQDIISVSAQNNFELFPNPVTDKLNISTNLSGSVSITIYDALGNKVYANKFEFAGQLIKQINLAELASGIYSVQLKNDAYMGEKKIIVTSK